jgi:broad specificity phosphatase PhoE
MFRRAKPAFLRIASEWQGRTVVVVSHAWMTQALISHVTGTGLPTYFRFAGANAVMTMAEVDPGGEGALHVLNGNADLATVSGGRVRPFHPPLEEAEQDWGAAARLGAGPERILGDLASSTRVWLIGHGNADDGRVRRVADRLTGLPIDAVHAADEPTSARAASDVGSGRDAGIHVEPGLLGVQDGLAATFQRIVEEGLGGAVALVAPATVVQRLICHVLESDMNRGGRFPLVPGALTVAEVGRDGRGILEMLNGRLSVGEVAGGRLLRTSTVP